MGLELGTVYAALGSKVTVRALDRKPVHGAAPLFDWLVGLSKIAMGNAGHSAGREITPEQNADLGRIIATFNSTRTE